jgi:hypothetical protein
LNGNDIAGATSSSYSIPVSVPADEGTYDCVVCGCGQEISNTALLDFGEPTITTQPDDYTAPLGGAAAFFVVATPSFGSLSYQWFHGATPVGINDDILVIGSITGSDYGEYSVVVTDACGPTMSNTVLLKPVNEVDKTKLARLLDVSISPAPSKIGCVGGSVTFTATGYPPGSTFVWRKDGSPMIPAETNSTLVLSSLAPADAGAYDVIVSFGSQSDESNDSVLSIADRPVITNQPDSVFIGSPGPVTFFVQATGQGPLSYQWQRKPPISMLDFQNIPGATEDTLFFETAFPANAGSYRCVITNLCGVRRSASANLTFL